MKITILNITQEIIDHAIQRSSNSCMLADGVRHAVASANYVHADLQSIRFTDQDKGVRYKYFTPPEAQKALIDFDQGNKVEPFTCILKDGTKSKVGLAATHPNFVRKIPKTKAKKPRIYPKREREFGLKKFVK